MHFRRRVCTEELRAQNDTRFLRGRQIASIIYENFRATGNYDAVQGLSDLCNVLTGLWPSGFRHKMGPCPIIGKWSTYRNAPGRFVQVKITRFCSASDDIGCVGTRNFSKQRTAELFPIEDCGQTSCWSADEDMQLQSPERNRWKRSSYQETKEEKSRRGEDSGRMSSVESNWTMFKRRLL